MTTWLWRPFSRVAGSAALGMGVAIMLVTAIIGWAWRGVYTDGVLDLHVGTAAALWVFFAQAGIAWLLPTCTLVIAGHALTATQYRFVDLLGTLALARWPLLPATIVVGLPAYRQSLQGAAAGLLNGSAAAGDYLIVLVLSIIPIVAIIWMVWLMFHAYTLVFNLRGVRAGTSFAVAVIAAEIISKILIVALPIS